MLVVGLVVYLTVGGLVIGMLVSFEERDDSWTSCLLDSLRIVNWSRLENELVFGRITCLIAVIRFLILDT
jgi:hypothetical protein